MELPDVLIDEIQRGRVVLFFGSGASIGASNQKNNKPPSGNDLAKLLSDRFLAGKHSQEPLDFISDLCIDQHDLIAVQEFIKETYIEYQPADFHLLLPKFKWKAIFTTNYDLIVESAYQKVKDKLQTIIPFISDYDRVEEKLKSESFIPYIKLHGCITRTSDRLLPLILTPDQYITHKMNRERLFNMLFDKGAEYPIIFIGHSGRDFDIRQNLLALQRLQNTRPRYYFIRPNFSEEESNYWSTKRIKTIQGTFEEFLKLIDLKIPVHNRKLQQNLDLSHPIEIKYTNNQKISQRVYDVLKNDVEFLHSGIQIEKGSPIQFYRGFDLGWYAIEQNLDVRRKLTDELLFETILNEMDRPSQVDFYIVKAEAGAGKSIFLRRLAWEAAIDGNVLCLYKRNLSNIDFDNILEIYRCVQERIFLFIDNAADNNDLILTLLNKAKRDQVKLTIISAERINEWNMNCQMLDTYVTKEFRLNYLDESEIENLLISLDEHDSLGYLKTLTIDQRKDKFRKEAGRQLLVALYEATLGKPFEEILIDEYNQIHPKLAQSVYLSVCVLNRLKVPVRAGILARIYEITFREFQEKLFAPLEHVVQVKEDFRADYYYYARHPLIAQIVFEEILKDKDEKFNEYSRILNALNISFNTDRIAFRQMVRGKTLLQLFPDHTAVNEIFRIAHQIAVEDPYVYQQHGIYEMNRANANLNTAYDYLSKAHQLDEKDPSIVHSFAELSRLKAEVSKSFLERTKYRKESISLSQTLLKEKSNKNYAFSTIVRVNLDQLKDLLTSETSHVVEIDKSIMNIENFLNMGLQEFPYDPYLLSTESEFSKLLCNQDRAILALKKAFEADKRNPFISNRLAKYYSSVGDDANARKVLKEAIERNPGERRLHFQYANILISEKPKDLVSILHHLRKSFVKSDNSYEAQFLYARFLFEQGGEETSVQSREIFKTLREVPIAHKVRTEIRSKWENDEGKLKTFTGLITKKEETYGFLSMDGRGAEIFFHLDQIGKEKWPKFILGDRVKFNIGFNFGGPIALGIQLV